MHRRATGAIVAGLALGLRLVGKSRRLSTARRSAVGTLDHYCLELRRANKIEIR
jgi:hypothetical protein